MSLWWLLASIPLSVAALFALFITIASMLDGNENVVAGGAFTAFVFAMASEAAWFLVFA